MDEFLHAGLMSWSTEDLLLEGSLLVQLQQHQEEGPGQVRPADLVQGHAELDPLQLGVVAGGEVLAAGTAGHNGPHVTDPVVDVRHDGPPPAHLVPLLAAG